MAEAPVNESESEDDSRVYSNTKDNRKERNHEGSKESDSNDLKEISSMEFQEYFKVNRMYGNENVPWCHKTILYYTLNLIPHTGDSVDSISPDYPKRNKMLNDPKSTNGTSGQHAEQKLVKVLKTEIISIASQDKFKYKEIKMNLKIVMNYSPCHKCATLIRNFRKKLMRKYNWEIEVSITFGTFYKCDEKNFTELVNLWKAGIKLQLVWDDDNLKQLIDKIGTKAERENRETIDRQYLQRVEIAAQR